MESAISQGIVVSTVNRFGRSLLSGLAAMVRVKAAGARFVSVQEGSDTSTDSGRLVLHIPPVQVSCVLDGNSRALAS